MLRKPCRALKPPEALDVGRWWLGGGSVRPTAPVSSAFCASSRRRSDMDSCCAEDFRRLDSPLALLRAEVGLPESDNSRPFAMATEVLASTMARNLSTTLG